MEEFLPITQELQLGVDTKPSQEYINFIADLRNSDEYHALEEKIQRGELKDNQTEVKKKNDRIIGTLLNEVLVFHYGYDKILEDPQTKVILNPDNSLSMQFDPKLFYTEKAGKIYANGVCQTESHIKQLLINASAVHAGKLAESISYEDTLGSKHVRVKVVDTTLASDLPVALADASQSFRSFNTTGEQSINSSPYSGVTMKNGQAEIILREKIDKLTYKTNQFDSSLSVLECIQAGGVIAEANGKPISLAVTGDDKYYFIGIVTEGAGAWIYIDKRNLEYRNIDLGFDPINSDSVEMPAYLAHLILKKLIINGIGTLGTGNENSY